MQKHDSDYDAFLDSKLRTIEPAGFHVELTDLHPSLFPWQAKIVQWGLHRGRAAWFEDCGLGKSLQELEWCRMVAVHTNHPVLILTPLQVVEQFEAEARKFSIPVTICESQADVQAGINITNYDKLHRFDPDAFSGLCCDESSILKSFDGKTRKALKTFADRIAYRLCGTATAAPNDLIELTNHAEHLGIMSGKEIIALYFTQDGNTTHKFRLMGHAKRAFWQWMAQWCVAMRRPSDLGYADQGFILPQLHVEHVSLESKLPAVEDLTPGENGLLFVKEAKTLNERRAARRVSMADKIEAMVEQYQKEPDRHWLIWCELDAEQDALELAFGASAVSIRGATPHPKRSEYLAQWQAGEKRVLITKPRVCGFGLNWQHCARMMYIGLTDSFEWYYQSLRRCWRFGQAEDVYAYIFSSEAEGAVLANIERKEKQAGEMMENIVAEMRDFSLGKSERKIMEYATETATGPDWTLYLGDSIQTINNIKSDSIGLSVFSPPFPGMYVYSNSPRDVGNCNDLDQMIAHFEHLVTQDKLYRVMMPGRTVAIHLTQMVAFKGVDGFIGLRDFRGRVISMMERNGWIYYGEVTIDKNPQLKAVRTKDSGLQFKSLATDSARMHMALADYILQFRKPGDNPVPIRAGISQKYNNPDGWITQNEWIEWAAPVWYRHLNPDDETTKFQNDYPSLMAEAKQVRRRADGVTYLNGILESDVLNVQQARETDDERHLCPLQLGVIERCVKLWSAPGETVYSPFAGIGSEGYQSLKLHRKFIGGELKRSYWESAIKNCNRAVESRNVQEGSLLSLMVAENDYATTAD